MIHAARSNIHFPLAVRVCSLQLRYFLHLQQKILTPTIAQSAHIFTLGGLELKI